MTCELCFHDVSREEIMLKTTKEQNRDVSREEIMLRTTKEQNNDDYALDYVVFGYIHKACLEQAIGLIQQANKEREEKKRQNAH